MKVLNKFDQVRYIDDVWHPRYSTKDLLVARWKIDKAKTDHIKFNFPKANSMKGDWYANRKQIKKCKKFINNGLVCYVVPLSMLEELTVNERDERMLW